MTTLDPALGALAGRPCRLHVIAAGAGAAIQAKLWERPGASAFLAGASFPYAPDEMAALLGYAPERFVAAETAMDLAIAAYVSAVDPERADVEPVGLGVTAAVATSRPRRGEPRVHVACVTRSRVVAIGSVLPSIEGDGARSSHASAVDDMGLTAIAVALGHLPMTNGWATAETELRTQLFARPFFAPDGTRAAEPPPEMPLFPGAFDPPHPGHFGIADAVDRPPAFTISATMPHKGPLGPQALLERVRRLRGRHVFLTQGDALYLDKVRRFPGRAIVVGADAFLRMFEPAWGDPAETHAALARAGARFVVVGRSVAGRWVAGEEAIRGHEDIATAIAGRWDMSSTEARGA
jgi:nicotinic acid mononucleotide adenylyltransferase